MKTKFNSIVLNSLLIAAIVSVTSCDKEPTNMQNIKYASVIDVTDDGTTSVKNANLQAAFAETGNPTSEEITSLLKMKAEEKLAHDVYTVLYKKYDSQVFLRISNAENNHLNAILLLLKYYGIKLTGEVGVFEDNNFQTLYNELIAKSSLSIEEAYKTGALIEEMDIKDLNEALNIVTNENIRLVYEILVKGSRNHLRAFNRQLTSLGLDYTPTYLTQDDFNQIVNSSIEKGNQYKMKGKGNGIGNGNGQGKGRKGQGNGNCNI